MKILCIQDYFFVFYFFIIQLQSFYNITIILKSLRNFKLTCGRDLIAN